MTFIVPEQKGEMMDDLIRRKDAIDLVEKHYRAHDNDELELIAYEVGRLPSAQSNLQPTCNQLATDAISRQAAIDGADAIIARDTSGNNDVVKAMTAWKSYVEALPSVQPERPKGKWNMTDAYPHNVYCSECHTRFAQTHWAVWEDGSLPRNFCPNCGAYMGGKNDEDD